MQKSINEEKHTKVNEIQQKQSTETNKSKQKPHVIKIKENQE